MHIPLVDLKAQYRAIQPDIDAAIARVLDHTSFIGGAEVSDFETAFAEFQGTKYCVGVASGTAALFLTMESLGIGAGDEVITSPHTFIATVEPLGALGARPVFVDIDPATFNLDPEKIEAAITPKTKAILPVHLYGQMANMDAITDIAARHRLHIIEDAAQAHGAEWAGRRAGGWGAAACFSFYPGKNLGAYGDAGAVCTDDRVLAAKINKRRDHGRTSKYAHDELAYGERLDSLQAAILGAKLPHLEEWTEARRHIGAFYDVALKGMEGVCTPFVSPEARHVYHIYCVAVRGDRDTILDSMKTHGVGAGVHYPLPLHLQPALAYLGYKAGDFPHTEAAAESIISLPIYPEMTLDAMGCVVDALGAAMQA